MQTVMTTDTMSMNQEFNIFINSSCVQLVLNNAHLVLNNVQLVLNNAHLAEGKMYISMFDPVLRSVA